MTLNLNSHTIRTTSRINVLAFIHFHRLLKQTGVGRVSYELLNAVAQSNMVNLHALGNLDDHRVMIAAGNDFLSSLQPHLFNTSRKQQQARWLILKQPKVEDFWPDADIVWCPAESYVPTSNARLVVTLHDVAHLEPKIRRATLSTAAQRAKWWWLLRVLESDAAAFVTVSEFSASRLIHYFPWIKDRLWVVHNAVPKRFLSPPSTHGDAALRNLGLNGTPIILVPGGLTYQKNGPLILAAWTQIRRANASATLVIAGTFEAELAAQCQDIGPEIHVLGYVSDEVLRSLYAQADVVWFPSRYEGFGIPVLEAMASGTPIVGCAASAIPEVAGDAAILLPTDAPDQHAEAILTLLEDSELCLKYKEKGLQQSRKFSWEASAQSLIDIFRRILPKDYERGNRSISDNCSSSTTQTNFTSDVRFS